MSSLNDYFPQWHDRTPAAIDNLATLLGKLEMASALLDECVALLCTDGMRRDGSFWDVMAVLLEAQRLVNQASEDGVIVLLRHNAGA